MPDITSDVFLGELLKLQKPMKDRRLAVQEVKLKVRSAVAVRTDFVKSGSTSQKLIASHPFYSDFGRPPSSGEGAVRGVWWPHGVSERRLGGREFSTAAEALGLLPAAAHPQREEQRDQPGEGKVDSGRAENIWVWIKIIRMKNKLSVVLLNCRDLNERPKYLLNPAESLVFWITGYFTQLCFNKPFLTHHLKFCLVFSQSPW